MKNKFKKQDFILITVILFLAALGFLGNHLINRQPAVIVKVVVDAEVVQELDLNKDTEFVVNGPQGGTNTIVIKDGGVSVTNASCPDKICMHQGIISQTGEIIVCLPNLMIVRIESKEAN